jgi:hypothetical protein
MFIECHSVLVAIDNHVVYLVLHIVTRNGNSSKLSMNLRIVSNPSLSVHADFFKAGKTRETVNLGAAPLDELFIPPRSPNIVLSRPSSFKEDICTFEMEKHFSKLGKKFPATGVVMRCSINIFVSLSVQGPMICKCVF